MNGGLFKNQVENASMPKVSKERKIVMVMDNTKDSRYIMKAPMMNIKKSKSNLSKAVVIM